MYLRLSVSCSSYVDFFSCIDLENFANDENLIDYLISFLIGSIILMAYFLLNSDVTMKPCH